MGADLQVSQERLERKLTDGGKHLIHGLFELHSEYSQAPWRFPDANVANGARPDDMAERRTAHGGVKRPMRLLKLLMKCLFGLLFVAAGANHFRDPAFYMRMMPPYLPWHQELVYLSGACEVVLGGLLFVPRYSRYAAWCLIALLIAVFPANLHMALHPEDFPEFGNVALWGRLPVQGLLIAWAYLFTSERERKG